MNTMSKRNASQEIVDYLLEQIQSGALKKGSKLPTEYELMEHLGVSRIPLREAICALRTVGILESRQGGGTYVTTKCDPTIMGRMLYDYAVLENVDLHQVLEVRMLLEPEAARQAALQATQRQREEILQIAQEYKTVVDHLDDLSDGRLQMSRWDKSFHQAIAKASSNDFLWILLVVADTSFGELNTRNARDMGEWGVRYRDLFAQQHLEIAQAILDENSSLAKKIMEKHTQQIRMALSARP